MLILRQFAAKKAASIALISYLFLGMGGESAAEAALSCWQNPQLAVTQVSGGNTGSFIRELSEAGARTIEACALIPDLSNMGSPQDQGLATDVDHHGYFPYLYFSVRLADSSDNSELGLMFQAKSPRAPYAGLIPYLRLPPVDGQARFLTLGNTTIYRFRAGEQVCMRASVGSGKIALEILPDRTFVHGPDGRLIPFSQSTAMHQSGDILQAEFQPRSGAWENQSSLRFARLTAIATTLHGKSLGSFAKPSDLGTAHFDVLWWDTMVWDGQGRSLAWAKARDLTFQNTSKSCAGTVEWPAQYSRAVECAGGRAEFRSIRGPSADAAPTTACQVPAAP